MSVRLLKVLVQPVFVSDDGTKLTELPIVKPAETNDLEGLPDQIEKLRQQLEEKITE